MIFCLKTICSQILTYTEVIVLHRAFQEIELNTSITARAQHYLYLFAIYREFSKQLRKMRACRKWGYLNPHSFNRRYI